MTFDLQRVEIERDVYLAYRRARPYDPFKITIVMLHSFLMDSTLYESQFMDTAYDKYNLIAIDEHGHGGTSGREIFTFWTTAEDSLTLLSKLGIDSFYVLGTSQGGFIALRMALLSPTRVKGLILLGTNAMSESPENIQRFKAGRDKWCASERPNEEALTAKAASFGGEEVVGHEVFQKIVGMWTERYAGARGYDPAYKCLCERDSVYERLSEITVPVLVMHGTNDKVYSVESARNWSGRLSNVWRFVVVAGGYHYLSFVSPGLDECRRVIPEFVRETA